MPKKKVKYQKKVPFVGLQKPLVKLLGTEKQKKYLKQYCIDNGTMIAELGRRMLEMNITTDLSQSAIQPMLRTDNTEVIWD